MAPKHSKELPKNFDGSGRDTPETFSWKQKALARQRRAVSVDEMSDVDYDSLPTASATIRAASLTPYDPAKTTSTNYWTRGWERKATEAVTDSLIRDGEQHLAAATASQSSGVVDLS